MAKLNQQADILKLGKIIIKELSNEDNDRLTLLEKWMGHYIAELINKVENTKNEKNRMLFQKECFETILKLWEKRSVLPSGNMPLSHIKSAINILNEIKREKDIWEKLSFTGLNSWEDLAVKIYETQMEAIRICIQAAIVEDAMEQEIKWLDVGHEYLSDEEKEIIEKLDCFLNESSDLTSIFDDGGTESINEEKNKIERAFDRLNNIIEEQKEAIRELKLKLIKND